MNKLRKTTTPSGMEVTYSSGNIFTDLGFGGEESANLLVRSRLMQRLQQYIEEEGLTQKEAAARVGVHQPRISALKTGKIDAFSIDALVEMLARAGLRVRVEFEEVVS